MRPSARRRGISQALLSLALLCGSGASAQDRTALASHRLRVELLAPSGAIELYVADAGRAGGRATLPTLLLDGRRQEGFTRVSGGDPVASNTALDVRMEIAGPGAVAVTWIARDGKPHDFELHLLSDDQTAYYGTGERFNALNQRGYMLPLVTDDRYGNKGVGSYKPVPYFMSSRGFGVWVDSYAPGSLDLSATERFTSKLRFRDDRLRVVFLAGPRFTEILEAYTALTGRTPVPPPWAFGLWKSRDVHHDRDSVLADVERLRRYNIPASVLVIDSPWETGYNTFEVNRRQFADAASMFERIRALGFELCLWLTPFVNDSNVIDMPGIEPVSANFAAAAGAGHLVEDANGEVARSRWWKGRGGLVDFTDPAAVAWWHSELRKTRAYGARAFKVDDGEGNFVPDAVFHDGTDAARMKNRYAILYDSVMQAFVDRDLGGDGVLLARSGYTGMQRFPFAWAGDNEASFAYDDGLPSVIIAGQTAALSGISLWGSDIAGYAGRPTKEVFLRWTQFAAFTPFMQVHMTSNLGPWDFDAEALDIFRRYASLRVQLFPYLYQAVHASASSGIPVIRPMALAFQDDSEAHRHVYQYMFGPDLLVAPVYREARHRELYLPAGRWVDYWSGESIEGPRTLEVEAPLDRIPLFVRAGALIPRLPEDVQTLVTRHPEMELGIVALDDRRVLEVWPGGAGAVQTWDGLSATVAGDERESVLRVNSKSPRPLTIRLVGQHLQALRVPGASVRDTERGTEIAFARFPGAWTMGWER